MTFLTHPDDATLQAFHDGALDPAEDAATRTHVETCDRCRARSMRYAAVFSALADAPVRLPQPPSDLFARVMARVESEGLVRVRERFRLRQAMPALLGGASVATAGGVLWLAGGGAAETSQLGSSLGLLVTETVARAGLIGTIVHSGAPLFAGAALATVAAVTPFLLRAFPVLQPRLQAARVSAR